MKKVPSVREIKDRLNDIMYAIDVAAYQLEKEEGLPMLVNASPELKLARGKLWTINLKNMEIATGKVLAIPTETHCGLCGGEHGSDISNNDDKYRCKSCKCTIKKTGMSIYREDLGSIFWCEGAGYIQN